MLSLKSLSQLDKTCKKYLFFYMLESMAAGISFFIAIYLHIYLKLSLSEISFIVASNVFGNLCGSFFTSKILDKTNPVRLASFALMTEGVCFILVTTTNQVWTLSLLMFLIGFGCYSFAIANNLFISNLAGEKTSQRTIVISFLNLSSNAGLAIGGIIVNLVAEKIPLLVFILLGITLFLVSLFYRSDSTKYRPQKVQDQLSPEVPPSHKKIYLLSLFVIFMVGILFAQQRVGYPIYLQNYFNTFQISLIFLLNSILLVFFLTATVNAVGRFNQIIVTGFGGLLLGLGMYFLQYIQTFAFLVIACIIFSVGEIIVTVFSQLLCFQCADKKKKGKATGLYRLLYALGTILGTFMGEKIQQLWGENYVWSFCGLTAWLVLTVCLIVSWNNDQHPPKQAFRH